MPSRLEPGTPKQPTDDHYHSLLVAIRAGRVAEVTQLLTEERAKGDHQHHTALFKAAVKGGQPQVLQCLLQHGVVPPGESPLFIAIEEISALEIVLVEGYSIHVTSSSTGKTPLQTAITLNPSTIQLLLWAGCDVTARDRVQGNTPLHTACVHHEESTILPLVRVGAWLNAVNFRGETPLYCLLRHAGDAHVPQDFHAKSRQSLARCLIHVGCHVAMTSSQHGGSGRGGRVGRPQYKVIQLYGQLLRETRKCVWPLQHLCRLTVRQLCEQARGKEGRGGGEEMEEEEERCEGEYRVGNNMTDVVESLGVSRFLKDYLLYKDHVFDKEALSPCKVKIVSDVTGDLVITR